MPSCGICGNGAFLPFTCHRCGGKFCGNHRLPEAHNCRGMRHRDWRAHNWGGQRHHGNRPKRWWQPTAPPAPQQHAESLLVTIIQLPWLVAKAIVDLIFGFIRFCFSLIRAAFGIIVVLALFFLIISIYFPSLPNVAYTYATANCSATNTITFDIEQRIFLRANEERAINGLPPLRWNPYLAELARQHSQRMVEENFFEHSFYYGVGENIGMMPTGNVEGVGLVLTKEAVADATVKSWMESPGHRANILNPWYGSIGVGVAQRNCGTAYYSTQDFQ